MDNNIWSTDSNLDSLGYNYKNNLSIAHNGNIYNYQFTNTGGTSYNAVIKTVTKIGSIYSTDVSLTTPNCSNHYSNIATITDRNDNIHSSFICEQTNNTCGLYYFTGTNLSDVTLVDTLTYTDCSSSGWSISMALDAEDHVSILYGDGFYPVEPPYALRINKIKLAQKNAGSFSTSILYELDASNLQDFISSADFGIDLQGRVHIVFGEMISTAIIENGSTRYTPANYSIKYLTNMNGTFQVSTMKERTGGYYDYDILPFISGVKINGMKSRSAR